MNMIISINMQYFVQIGIITIIAMNVRIGIHQGSIFLILRMRNIRAIVRVPVVSK